MKSMVAVVSFVVGPGWGRISLVVVATHCASASTSTARLISRFLVQKDETDKRRHPPKSRRTANLNSRKC